jgi:hypothetical protein
VCVFVCVCMVSLSVKAAPRRTDHTRGACTRSPAYRCNGFATAYRNTMSRSPHAICIAFGCSCAYYLDAHSHGRCGGDGRAHRRGTAHGRLLSPAQTTHVTSSYEF